MSTIYAGAGTARNYFSRRDQSGEDGLGGSVSIEGSELEGTQSPRWPQDQGDKRHLPSEVRCQQLPAGPPATSAPQSTPKDNTKTHHNRGVLPHLGFDAWKTHWGTRTITRTPYPMAGRKFCVWIGAPEHCATKCGVTGGFGQPEGMELKARALYA